MSGQHTPGPWVWDGCIRIQRDHWAVPYLERGETPPSTRPTASEHPEYSPELVERMVALVRDICDLDVPHSGLGKAALAILSELDKSKEDRRLEAEALAIVLADETTRTDRQEQAIRDGRAGQSKRAIALAALRRGMELAKDGAA